MSILANYIIKHAMGQGNPDDGLAKENRSAMRKLLEQSAKENNAEQIAALTGAAQKLGIDISPYKAIAEIQTPEQRAQGAFDTAMAKSMQTMLNGGVAPAPTPQEKMADWKAQWTQPSQSTPQPAAPTAAPTQQAPAQPTSPAPQIFSQDFLQRAAIKKYSGIDVGAHYFEAGDWFQAYGARVKSGVPVEQAISDTAVEYGFIPDGASNLEGLSEPDRKAIFEREFGQALNDPTISALIGQHVPKGADANKYKAGAILDAFAQQGRYIPEHYQPLLDRYRSLDEPDFITDEMKTWAYEITKKMPSELTPSDIARVRKTMQNDAVIQAARQAAATTTGRTQAEWDMEMQKPVSSEDRAKYGIKSGIKTYAQLADEGKRFASDADRKMYQELDTLRSRMADMEVMLFGTKDGNPVKDAKGKPIKGGIFTGIGNAIDARAAARGRLAWEKAKGSQRGQNTEVYNDTMAYFARSLIRLAGESGSRLSDQDVAQIVQSMSDTGRGLLGVPDSEAIARAKYDRFFVEMGRAMKKLEESTTIEPVEEPPASPTGLDADAAAQALIDKYSKGQQ